MIGFAFWLLIGWAVITTCVCMAQTRTIGFMDRKIDRLEERIEHLRRTLAAREA